MKLKAELLEQAHSIPLQDWYGYPATNSGMALSQKKGEAPKKKLALLLVVHDQTHQERCSKQKGHIPRVSKQIAALQ